MSTVPSPAYLYLSSLNLPPPSSPLLNTAGFFDVPSTPLAKKAVALMENLLPTWGLNHCYRTFCYALAITSAAGWDRSPQAEEFGWDREAIFLACFLHDIGWDEKEVEGEDGKRSRLSFEIFGGIKAREALLKWGANRSLADEVCEAIVRHTEREHPGGIRLLQACVNLGAGQDIVGWAVPSLVHPLDHAYIMQTYPRVGFTDEFLTLAGKEWTHKPGCLFEKEREPVAAFLIENLDHWRELDGEREAEELKANWRERRLRVDLDSMTLDGVPF